MVWLEKAVEHVRVSPGVILDHLGDAHHKVGNREQALTSWRKAAEDLRKEKDYDVLKKTQEKIQRHAN